MLEEKIQPSQPYRCVLEMFSVLKALNPTLEFVGRLFNTSNFEYYLKQVQDFIAGKCAFCPPDPAQNNILEHLSSPLWMVWVNKVAARPGQDYQLIIVPRRHVLHYTELNTKEIIDLFDVLRAVINEFKFTGYSLVIRSGDPAHHAGSIAHLHVNVHHANGSGKLEVTLGKSEADLNSKLPVLLVWEKMRLNLASGHHRHDGLTPEEMELIKPKDKKPKAS